MDKSILAQYGINRIVREYCEFGDLFFHFEVSLKAEGKAWMKQLFSKQSDAWIVMVIAQPIIVAWTRDGREHHLAKGDESTWRSYYKFHNAEKGFSSGASNPVPLVWCDGEIIQMKGSD